MATPFSSVSEKFFKIIKVNITTITCLFTCYPFPLSLHAVLLIPYNNIFTNHSLHPHRHPTTIIYVKHMSISLYSLFQNFIISHFIICCARRNCTAPFHVQISSPCVKLCRQKCLSCNLSTVS